MKKLLGLWTAAVLLLAACNNGTPAEGDPAQGDAGTQVADMHNAENSLDIAGLYTGTVPCADCEGIETTLTLNGDGSFALKENYKGKKDPLVVEMQGKWVIHENTLTLQFAPEVQDRVLRYRAEEGRLRQLDQAGNRIEGSNADQYILHKQA